MNGDKRGWALFPSAFIGVHRRLDGSNLVVALAVVRFDAGKYSNVFEPH